MQLHRSGLAMLVPMLAAALTVACEDGPTGPEDAGLVAIQFGTAPASQGGTTSSRGMAAVLSSHGGSLTLEGENGTLTITDLRVIVEEFELERANAECDDLEDDDACEKFEVPPYFLDLPLSSTSTVTAVNQQVPPDTYEELELEIDNLDTDADDDPQEAQQAQELLDQIRSQANLEDWPEKASLVVVGSFAPADGSAARDFKAYFRAEIEVELEFATPLTIGAGEATKVVSVEIDPAMWFGVPGTGDVMDLSQFDFDPNAELPRFEVEIENGWDVEWDD